MKITGISTAGWGWPVIFQDTTLDHWFKISTFSKRKVSKKGCPDVVAVKGEAVVDYGGGEPQVVDDQGVFP
jgi:hypothetical protein